MKALVFGGSGKIGSAVAWDLAKDKDVEVVGITGRREEALQETKKWIGSEKIVLHAIDLTDRESALRLMEKYDVGALTLPDRRRSYKTAHFAIEAGLNIVDTLEEYHRRPDAYETEGLELPNGMTLNEYGDWLHQTAIANGVTFLDGMGFAPGLSNVTVGQAIRKMDTVESAVARVGGIPAKEFAKNHPLKYMITWAFEHVLREYMIKLNVVKNGRVVEVPAIEDRETFRFTKFGQDEELQCAVTPGMPSFIFSRPELKEFAEKTVRWPGHFPGIDTLKECGLLDLQPHDFNGHRVVPREFLLSLITPKLRAREGETDVCVMYNTVKGKKKGKDMKIEHFMWDQADKKNGISSMMRATGYPIAIGAKLLLEGAITEKGIVPPEDAIDGTLYDRFMNDLKARGIEVLEVVEES
ncbi:MAG: saccharopine dehydrogenase NADP-binding domain-containing protein [Candidatus Eiseniibacteriota bacterium]|nr:MAG: saccharopine dehydrogenase NADP-binding domain-containing protein [Candidatus Eisenbacteria bacterium]